MRCLRPRRAICLAAAFLGVYDRRRRDRNGGGDIRDPKIGFRRRTLRIWRSRSERLGAKGITSFTGRHENAT